MSRWETSIVVLYRTPQPWSFPPRVKSEMALHDADDELIDAESGRIPSSRHRCVKSMKSILVGAKPTKPCHPAIRGV